MNSNIFFQPFVGKDYANGGIFGKRIMILWAIRLGTMAYDWIVSLF